MIINNKATNIIEHLNKNNFYIITDFDGTLTDSNAISTWEIFSNTDFMNTNYINEVENNDKYYMPKEKDLKIPLKKRAQYMHEWWIKHLDLFIKYKLKEDYINNIKKDTIKLRNKTKDFLYLMHNNNIHVVIMSSGIGNFIDKILQLNNCFYNNIDVVSNYLIFENNIVVSYDKSNMIHSLNKNISFINSTIIDKIKNKKYAILLGNQVEDIYMTNQDKDPNTLKIGFAKDEQEALLFQKYFDIIITSNSFKELLDIIKPILD